jgi:hypothetical protein
VGFGSGIKDFLLLPWNLTMHSSAFGEKVAIGPAFLAFLPALALIKNVERKIKLLLACALLFIIPWFLTAQIVRYIFIVYAILAIASAYAITRMLKEKALGIAAVAALTAIILINAGIWAGANSDELRAAAGIQDKEKFLMQSMTNYGLLEYANQNLENAKICLYGEMNGYYSDNDYVWCHPGYQGYVDFSTIGTGEKLLDRFREIQVTHLLVENSMNGWRKKYEQSGIVTGLMLLNNSDKAVGELLENNSELLYENENGAIYKIKYD